MRNTKKILAALTALTLVGSMSFSAFAGTETTLTGGSTAEGNGSATDGDIISITFPTDDEMDFALDQLGLLSYQSGDKLSELEGAGSIVHKGATILNKSTTALAINFDISVESTGTATLNIVDEDKVNVGNGFNVYLTAGFSEESVTDAFDFATDVFTGSDDAVYAIKKENHAADCAKKADPLDACDEKATCVDSAQFDFIIQGADYDIVNQTANRASVTKVGDKYAHANGCTPGAATDVELGICTATTPCVMTENPVIEYEHGTVPGGSTTCTGGATVPGIDDDTITGNCTAATPCTMSVKTTNPVGVYTAPVTARPAGIYLGEMEDGTANGTQIQIGGLCNVNAAWDQTFFGPDKNAPDNTISVKTVFSYAKAVKADVDAMFSPVDEDGDPVAPIFTDGAYGLKEHNVVSSIFDKTAFNTPANAWTVVTDQPTFTLPTGVTITEVSMISSSGGSKVVLYSPASYYINGDKLSLKLTTKGTFTVTVTLSDKSSHPITVTVV